MNSKKDFRERPVPPSLKGLPRFGFTSRRSATREESDRHDIAFGIRSLNDLMSVVEDGFADPETSPRPSSLSRAPRK
jgi:hypothetical protein